MDILLKTPGAVWAEALYEFREQVDSFLKKRATVPFSTYYINEEDGKIEITDNWDLMIGAYETLCIAEILNNDIHRVVHINTHHWSKTDNNCADNYVTFDFIVYDDSESSGVNQYDEITDLRFSYKLLQDKAIYEGISQWINGNELNISIFSEHEFIIEKTS